MDFRSSNRIVLSHELGNSLIVGDDPTNLEWHPWGVDNDLDLPEGDYEYDLKLPMPVIGAVYPIRGIAKVTDNTTK